MNLTVLFWSFSIWISSDVETLNKLDVRSTFHVHMNSEQTLLEISELKLNSDNAVLMGYQGISEAMLADHAFFVFSKYSHFKRGKEKIERAIQLEPYNAELRYLRLLVQLNTPRFLGYHQEIEEDFNHFMKHISYSGLSQKWISTFAENLLTCDNLNPQFRLRLVQLLKP